MIDKCKDCRFWLNNDDVWGFCKRYAPAPVDTVQEVELLVARWPVTAHLDGCGDFDRVKPL